VHAGPLPGIYDPTGPGKLLFAFFAAMAETERENIRESTLEGLDTAARKGKHGGRPPVITDDMLHTVLRRRAAAADCGAELIREPRGQLGRAAAMGWVAAMGGAAPTSGARELS
jgi:DNA invertase Pin-like site-specific DNA recombinase